MLFIASKSYTEGLKRGGKPKLTLSPSISAVSPPRRASKASRRPLKPMVSQEPSDPAETCLPSVPKTSPSSPLPGKVKSCRREVMNRSVEKIRGNLEEMRRSFRDAVVEIDERRDARIVKGKENLREGRGGRGEEGGMKEQLKYGKMEGGGKRSDERELEIVQCGCCCCCVCVCVCFFSRTL